MTNEQKLNKLADHCFEIEATLPDFNFADMDNASDDQVLRQRLYRIRCEIGLLSELAKKRDLIKGQSVRVSDGYASALEESGFNNTISLVVS